MYDKFKIHTRTLFLILLCISSLSFLCLPVYSHSGRTDGSGGHTKHSTGEYHYHHGYPAHDHYDVDGDGSIDCPYNFLFAKKRINSSRKQNSETIFSEISSYISSFIQFFSNSSLITQIHIVYSLVGSLVFIALFTIDELLPIQISRQKHTKISTFLLWTSFPLSLMLLMLLATLIQITQIFIFILSSIKKKSHRKKH